ncbi:MAG TPA: hypothetical protein PKL31_17690 [Fulvivirga sp.]|nr:hypothetical protein [Fulvivirga sp.]
MKQSITLLLVLALSISSYAQESAKYQKLKAKNKYKEGYVITNDSVKTEGLIKDFYNAARQYAEVSFVKLDGSLVKYLPSELIEFGYDDNKFAANMASFYQVIVEGQKVSLYKSMTVSTAYSMYGPGGVNGSSNYTSTSTDLYFRKTGEKDFKWIRKKDFSEVFSTYFEDCNALKAKILDGVVGRLNIDVILEEYNNCQ